MLTQTAARHSGKGAIISCLAPDVCLTPMGSSMVPVPYMIISKLEWAQRTAPSITFTELEAFTMNSRTNKVTGNEAGTGGGVVSGVNAGSGWCRPRSKKSNVFVEGHELIQNDNLYDMNCAGPDGAANTVGKLIYAD
ncbi:MAG: PAAR-like domain-containing protein [Pseudomonadota bacterium]